MSSPLDWIATNWQDLGKGAVAALTLATVRQWGRLVRDGCRGCWSAVISWVSAPYERDLLKRQLTFTKEQEEWAAADLAEARETIAELKRRLAAGDSGANSGPWPFAREASTPTTIPAPHPRRRTRRPSAKPPPR